MRKSYRIKLKGQIYDTKAENATEAKRNVAHTYRNRGKYWDITIGSLMKQAKVW